MALNRPEILAPVGTWEMCLAAVHNGADAIYVGMPGFNARGRAEKLTIDTLAEMIDFCHLYGVKVFLAFNVLIFEDELESVIELLHEVLPLNPDALIVQDIGLIKLIKEIAPHQAVHASTQMTITCAEAIEGTSDLEMARYVLARELSIDEIQKIREATTKELEVFVHGALCVSYSGQCLTSESLGGRSANRGQCAQSCRLPYELMVDGDKKELGDRRYLVSPKDLCAVNEAPQLAGLGVDSFKIEGRLKTPEYVAATSRAYRSATDSTFPQTSDTSTLKIVYSRDFFSGWMHGVNHQELVRADFSSHVGLEIGVIQEVEADAIVISSSHTLKNGDGLLFLHTGADKRWGSPIYSVKQLENGHYRIGVDHDLALSELQKGFLVFLNSSPEVQKRLRGSFTQREHFKRMPLTVHVTGRAEEPLTATVTDAEGISITLQSEQMLSKARTSVLSAERLRDEFSALAGTVFSLGSLTSQLDGELYFSDRDLRKLRQKSIEALSKARLRKNTPQPLSRPVHNSRSLEKVVSKSPSLSVLIRSEDQLDALSGLGITEAYLDFEFGKVYERAIAALRDLGIRAGIATTRILKPQEKGHLKYIERLKPDMVLVRNLGALHYLRDSEIPLIGDFSLNITNSRTAAWFLGKNLERITPSYDLNQSQLVSLLNNSPSDKFEVTIHQYMPAFHMEHCVFAAFLSSGTSWRDCGKPCEKHRVDLRTPNGALHPLKADAECRNTMFNGDAQSAARLVPSLLQSGVSHFRFEALFESADELRRKLAAYSEFLAEKVTIEELFQRCRSIEQYGVSDGQLLSIRSYKDRKKEGGYERPEQVQQVLGLR